MKCSPFSRGLRKGGKHMHHHRGRFMKHFMRRCTDGYESSSSSSSAEDRNRNETESAGYDMQHKMGMKSKVKHDFGMDHGHDKMRHNVHDMRHRRRHGHSMMHRMRHGHGMMHRMGHGHGMKHEMRHSHDERRWHDRKHGKRYDYAMEHKKKHHHGMKHKMHHSHGRHHKIGHGPGMRHKLRHEVEKSCPGSQNEERPIEVDIDENMQESSENEVFTFYKPKTNAHVMNENDTFLISLETSYYQPEEVTVKIANGKIDVSAMHESMEDDIYEFHEMYRSFNIPNNVNPEVITARIDTDGKLIIEARCNNNEENLSTERDIPVIPVSE